MNRAAPHTLPGGAGAHGDLVSAVMVRDLCAACGWTVAEFAEYYAPRAREELAELVAAHEANDGATLRRLAHGAAGSSSSAGMTALTAVYRTIEQSARDGDADAIARLLSQASAQIEAGVAALRSLGDAK